MDKFTFATIQGSSDVIYCEAISLPKVIDNNAIYITDSNTVKIARQAKNFLDSIPLVIIDAGEENKSFKSVEKILKKALDSSLNRNAVFIGIGGGVVCDLTAFSASIYMRGVYCKLVPTSLLAMVDASIGGKTGINFIHYKNMVGTFYKAGEIYICLKAIDSLNDEEYLSGLAEVFKKALLFSDNLSIFIEKQRPLLNRDKGVLFEVIKQAILIKSSVVERDFYEKNERCFLNYGHTFAHALESVLDFKISHGSAVAWGIWKALNLGKNLGITDKDYANKISKIIEGYNWFSKNSFGSLEDLCTSFNLKISNDEFIEKMLFAMKKDKKNTNNKIKFVLQKKHCENVLQDVELNEIKRVLK